MNPYDWYLTSQPHHPPGDRRNLNYPDGKPPKPRQGIAFEDVYSGYVGWVINRHGKWLWYNDGDVTDQPLTEHPARQDVLVRQVVDHLVWAWHRETDREAAWKAAEQIWDRARNTP